MRTWQLAAGGGFGRGWTRLYTTGLPAQVGGRRRTEIASDLWEQATYAGDSGDGPGRTAALIFGRTVLGMPADVSWHVAELGGPEMEGSLRRKALVGLTVVVAGLSLMTGVGMTVGLFIGGWSLTDGVIIGPIYLLGVIGGLAGPFVALAGVYLIRQAESEGRSLTRGRTLLVAGMGGIALLALLVFWTIIGPIIAVVLAVYWVRKVRSWTREHPALA